MGVGGGEVDPLGCLKKASTGRKMMKYDIIDRAG